MFSTLQAANTLEEAGFTREQAEALAHVLYDWRQWIVIPPPDHERSGTAPRPAEASRNADPAEGSGSASA